MMQGLLAGKTCLITGGGRGIGRAVAERFLAEGAKGVTVVDRNHDELGASPRFDAARLHLVEGDVTDPSTHARGVAGTIERFSALDVLVANAGVFDFRKRVEAYEPQALSQAFDELFAVNVKGYLYAINACATELRRSRGAIVMTGSVASCHAGGGGVLYTGAKHAILGIARQTAHELAPDVRVNVVAPGGTDTRLSGIQALGHEGRELNAREGFRERIANHVPLAFAQQPEDHTGAYVFLASRELSPAMTGCILMSDGGVGIRSL